MGSWERPPLSFCILEATLTRRCCCVGLGGRLSFSVSVVRNTTVASHGLLSVCARVCVSENWCFFLKWQNAEASYLCSCVKHTQTNVILSKALLPCV